MDQFLKNTMKPVFLMKMKFTYVTEGIGEDIIPKMLILI